MQTSELHTIKDAKDVVEALTALHQGFDFARVRHILGRRDTNVPGFSLSRNGDYPERVIVTGDVKEVKLQGFTGNGWETIHQWQCDGGGVFSLSPNGLLMRGDFARYIELLFFVDNGCVVSVDWLHSTEEFRKPNIPQEISVFDGLRAQSVGTDGDYWVCFGTARGYIIPAIH